MSFANCLACSPPARAASNSKMSDRNRRAVEALAEVVLNEGEAAPLGRCLACADGDSAHDAVLPHGTEPTGRVWLHSRCWPAWHAGRRADAVAALKAMGIQDS